MNNDIEYIWNPEKNRKLIAERNISFEEILEIIIAQEYIEIMNHPNQEKYPQQKIYVLPIHDYIYLVPFEKKDNIIYLKTIFPSRKATKKYFPSQS